ncbi:Mitotic spindle checkpoint protein MAD2 [Linum perenne]
MGIETTVMEEKAEEEQAMWSRETVPRVMKIVLDFRETTRASERLVATLTLFHGNLHNMEALTLNVCQKIYNKGIEVIIGCCTELRIFSVYWNVRVLWIGFIYDAEWLEAGKLQRVVLVIMSKATAEVLERWNFSIKTDSEVVERMVYDVVFRSLSVGFTAPFSWIESTPKLISNPQMIHKVNTLVSYKNDKDSEEE